MLNIRPASKKDAPVLREILSQLGKNYTRTVEEIQNRIESFEGLSRHQLLVAESEDKVVACIAFGCYEQFRLQGCCCHIDTLIVEKSFKGKGIGKALIGIAEAFAKQHHVTEIELTTANYRKMHGTHDFYKSLGYEDHEMIDCTYFVKQSSLLLR